MSLDTIAPTPERLAKGDLEAPSVDRKTERRTYKTKPIEVPAGIDGDMARAFAQFVGHVERAQQQQSCIGSYGESIGGSDKQAGMDSLIDKRMRAGWAITSAVYDMSDPVTRSAIVMLAAGHTPEGIGRDLLGRRNRPQAVAAATERIRAGCWHLAVHYGYISRRDHVP